MPPKLPLKRGLTLENSIITSQEIQHLQFSANARTDHRSLITNHLLAPKPLALERVVLYKVPIESRVRLNTGKHTKAMKLEKKTEPIPALTQQRHTNSVSGRPAKLLHNLSFSLSSLSFSLCFSHLLPLPSLPL